MKDLKEITRALAAALDPLTPEKGLPSLDSRLIERAVREGVTGVLFKSLLSSGRWDTLDRVHRETLEPYYYQTLRRNLRLLRARRSPLSSEMNNPAASCGVSLKDTEITLERSKLRGTDRKRD
ncbi:MAG: hypothetical protein ACM335_11300 [Deltaproteobacteria bacterium]